jgi:hypothetical protein
MMVFISHLAAVWPTRNDFSKLSYGGQGDSLVPPYTRRSVCLSRIQSCGDKLNFQHKRFFDIDRVVVLNDPSAWSYERCKWSGSARVA